MMHQPVYSTPCTFGTRKPKLTSFQYDILRRMANSKTTKLFTMLTGITGDNDPEAINRKFNETCMLVQFGLCRDITGWPRFEHIVEENAAQGREVIIIEINAASEEMFKKVKWEKYVN